MFAYGVCVGGRGKFEAVCLPGIKQHEPGSLVIPLRGQRSIAAGYNEVLRQVRALPEPVEGLVLLHDDTRLDGPVSPRLRALFADEQVAVVGSIGAVGHRTLSWWDAEVRGFARDAHLGDLGQPGGEHDVDMVDGYFLALSPWAVRTLTFDERYPGFHAYDADLCSQARAAGRRVVATDLPLFHDSKAEARFGDYRRFALNDYRWRLKWLTDAPAAERLDWRYRRARLAVARAISPLRDRVAHP